MAMVDSLWPPGEEHPLKYLLCEVEHCHPLTQVTLLGDGCRNAALRSLHGYEIHFASI